MEAIELVPKSYDFENTKLTLYIIIDLFLKVQLNFALISKKIKLDEEIREKEFNMYEAPTKKLGIKKGTNTGLATGDYDQGTISIF